ncbi:MAG: hypothetical protein PHE83_15425 [Opitutaceae bacterium]|nr:hypothetical protein [Opitutaceae bacterium]
MSLQQEWCDVENVLRGAVDRIKNIDCGSNTNWSLVNETLLLAGLAAGCSLLEKSGLKGSDEHISVLFDIRNALVHNGGDLSKNTKKTALTEATDYLANSKHRKLSNQFKNPFFSLSGSVVSIKSDILFALRLCMP